MKKRLVLIGGGHAHMVTLAKLETFVHKGVDVTVIQPSEYHYYSGMGPGMLGGTYLADDIRFATKKLVERKGGTFVLDKAVRIDPEKRQVYVEGSEEGIGYDVLSCNAGSFVADPFEAFGNEFVFASKPIEELQRARELILQEGAQKSLTVAVIGSGPSAVEIAGNVHQLCTDNGLADCRVVLLGGQTFMRGRPSRVQKLVRKILVEKGVEVLEGSRVGKIDGHTILLENGESMEADIIFPATGVNPSSIFSSSGLSVGPDGGLKVNNYLQSVDYENIFGGGDCIYFESEPLDKVGVYAVRQNPVLYANLMKSLTGEPLERFAPGGTYLLIYNLGSGQGVLSKWSITFGGRFAFVIKDYIDRKFISEFQDI